MSELPLKGVGCRVYLQAVARLSASHVVLGVWSRVWVLWVPYPKIGVKSIVDYTRSGFLLSGCDLWFRSQVSGFLLRVWY